MTGIDGVDLDVGIIDGRIAMDADVDATLRIQTPELAPLSKLEPKATVLLTGDDVRVSFTLDTYDLERFTEALLTAHRGDDADGERITSTNQLGSRIRGALQAAKEADSTDRNKYIKAALEAALALPCDDRIYKTEIQEQLTNALEAPDEEVPYFINQCLQLVTALDEFENKVGQENIDTGCDQ